MLPPTEPKSPYRAFPPCTVAEPGKLNFAALMPFELVKEQYHALGVRFEGAIALQPSNPAFALFSRSVALMPVSNKPFIGASFQRPVQQVGAVVSGARLIRLTAFDRHSNVLQQSYTERPPAHSPTTARSFPQHPLAVSASGIARVVFASDSPFLLDEFCFG